MSAQPDTGSSRRQDAPILQKGPGHCRGGVELRQREHSTETGVLPTGFHCGRARAMPKELLISSLLVIPAHAGIQ
jgi:hypothetical protein